MTEVVSIKKRNRNTLEENSRDLKNKRYVIENSCYLEGSKAKPVYSKNHIRNRHLIRANNLPDIEKINNELIESYGALLDQANLIGCKNIYNNRRHAIYYFFKLFGSPSKIEWKESNIVNNN